jgi:hypothetical protein
MQNSEVINGTNMEQIDISPTASNSESKYIYISTGCSQHNMYVAHNYAN